jgi:hypothetical protein
LQRIEQADRFFAATGAEIRHGGTSAFYAVGPDYVQMPPFETRRRRSGRRVGGPFGFLPASQAAETAPKGGAVELPPH